jgi:hypothetical protein
MSLPQTVYPTQTPGARLAKIEEEGKKKLPSKIVEREQVSFTRGMYIYNSGFSRHLLLLTGFNLGLDSFYFPVLVVRPSNCITLFTTGRKRRESLGRQIRTMLLLAPRVL